MPRRFLLAGRTAIVLLVTIASILLAVSTGLASTRIAPGDRLHLTVFNHADLSTELTVSSTGDVRVPLVGLITVSGMSETEASSRISAALSAYFFHPAADIRLVSQAQAIFFSGLLVGVAGYQAGETLAPAIGAFRQAIDSQPNSGTNGTAFESIDMRRVRIDSHGRVSDDIDVEALRRAGEPGPVLQPGDVVLFRAKPIRVEVQGSIEHPATLYVYTGVTLAQAVAEVGPLPTTTSLSDINLRRDAKDSIVSVSGNTFNEAAQDGDVVTLRSAPRVSVLGMVEKAGDETLQTRLTLLDALYEAGGPNKYADLAHVKITHDGTATEVNITGLAHGDLSQNVKIADGDVIFVPEGHRIDGSLFASIITSLASVKYLGGL